ncbi:hypothetical protein [Bartonella sp. WD12.1]|uniref:hypothetical protein n=1 Tax=Bartonella sp. WD12.1 TaxID=1933903 RepID=UPI00099ACE3E|nr:hypothetical protein [Bartonella sp. WD12.1]
MMGGMIVGKGGETSKGVVMMGTGTVELNKVEVESFLTGVSVSDGTVKINGGSTIKAAGDDGVGIKITEKGKAEVIGATIEAKGDRAVGIKATGTGLKHRVLGTGASATMMGGKIQGSVSVSGGGGGGR